MTKATGIGRGGRRAGGRPKGSLNKRTLAKLAANQANNVMLKEPLPGGLAIPALHRLVDDASTGLERRLRRIEQTGQDQSKRLDEALETLQRVLRHQTAIARVVGAIEPIAVPRHTRRRPLGT